MKHYVLGFIFDQDRKRVLLIRKEKPDWQNGRWNGVGGKVESNDGSPLEAIQREGIEETGYEYIWEHCVTFVCPGGTVFVFKAISDFTTLEEPVNHIAFEQIESEKLEIWRLDSLPGKVDIDLSWLIAVCLSKIRFPILVYTENYSH